MQNVHDLQKCFISSMLSNTLPDEAFTPTPDILERLEVYRYNFMAGYLATLKQTFPMTANYMEDTFNSVAISYILTLPQKNPLLSEYGRTFPEYLTDNIAAELAKLEWLLHTAVLMPEDIKTNDPPKDLQRAHWQLRSDVILCDSSYPIVQLYQQLKRNISPTLIQPKHSYYVIYRPAGMPTILPLTVKEYQVLTCLLSPILIDELFDKLTFPKLFWVNFLEQMFNAKFLKVAHVNPPFHSSMRSDI